MLMKGLTACMLEGEVCTSGAPVPRRREAKLIGIQGERGYDGDSLNPIKVQLLHLEFLLVCQPDDHLFKVDLAVAGTVAHLC